MIDKHAGSGHRCRNCGRFAHAKYEWAGPSYGERTYCPNCES